MVILANQPPRLVCIRGLVVIGSQWSVVSESHWKLAAGDFTERQFWDDYQEAYEAAINLSSSMTEARKYRDECKREMGNASGDLPVLGNETENAHKE